MPQRENSMSTTASGAASVSAVLTLRSAADLCLVQVASPSELVLQVCGDSLQRAQRPSSQRAARQAASRASSAALFKDWSYESWKSSFSQKCPRVAADVPRCSLSCRRRLIATLNASAQDERAFVSASALASASLLVGISTDEQLQIRRRKVRVFDDRLVQLVEFKRLLDTVKLISVCTQARRENKFAYTSASTRLCIELVQFAQLLPQSPPERAALHALLTQGPPRKTLAGFAGLDVCEPDEGCADPAIARLVRERIQTLSFRRLELESRIKLTFWSIRNASMFAIWRSIELMVHPKVDLDGSSQCSYFEIARVARDARVLIALPTQRQVLSLTLSKSPQLQNANFEDGERSYFVE
eukprot:6200442-Pleurochrysis_carterae.AAC.4